MKDPVATAAHPSESYAPSRLPPAYPKRAAWGTAAKLRAWQAEALEQYQRHPHADFLLVATPGAGKTTFALTVARRLVDERAIDRVYIVTPTEHLKTQWANAAHRVGLPIDPHFSNAQGQHSAHYRGLAVTYAQVAAKPALHRAKTEAAKTLVILDEIHHAGDALSWGVAVQEAFEPARRRLALTGTPFRSDASTIPFVEYAEEPDGSLRSRADYTYGYARALQDQVVRPVLFMAYCGQMRWRTSGGEEREASLSHGGTKDMTAHAWRTALDPQGEWIHQVLTAAHERLRRVRRTVSDAGGLVIASDQEDARAYARLLGGISGGEPTLVLSDDAGASERIDQFAAGAQEWMVAVRMVSEGVDIPRLAVGVYATSAATPMFFAQAVGRFVRTRHRGETASIFLPSVPTLMAYAHELEVERDHVLDAPVAEIELTQTPDQEPEHPETERTPDSSGGQVFEALESQASFDRVLFDGGEFGGAGSPDGAEEEFLGIPGLLEADQVALLLQQRARQDGACAERAHTAGQEPMPDHRRLLNTRRDLARHVAAWAARTGTPHGVIHQRLRQVCGGPPVGQATEVQLRRRISELKKWFVGSPGA